MTQGLVLGFTGAVLLRLALSDAYLRYVTSWMKWPLIASAVLLLLVAAYEVFGPAATDPSASDAERHPPPRAAWLLFLPGIAVFTISPPELGSFLAERRAGDQPVVAPVVSEPLAEQAGARIPVGEFIGRAQHGQTLEGRSVTLTGFVSRGRDGDAWYVTRMAIGCCAADALVLRVEVRDQPAPPRDTWIQVRGTWVTGSGAELGEDPAITAEEVTDSAKPSQTYE